MTPAGWLDGAVLRPCGEGAVSVEFGDRIDAALTRRAGALADALAAARPPGLIEVVPTYRAVLVEFDATATSPEALWAALPPQTATGPDEPASEHRVEVGFSPDEAEDLEAVAAALGLERQEVVRRLLDRPLIVGMYGFAPGFAYLTGLDPRLSLPRRAAPRPPVTPGSLLIAAGQAAIAPAPMPTGWYVVGRTATRMFDVDAAERGAVPVPFRPGDTLRLVPADPGRAV